MRIIKCKEIMLARIVAFLLLVLGLMHNGFTQCTLEDNSYLFSHQTFKYGSWTVAADSIETVIPQALCDSKPYRYFSAGTFDSSAAVSVDSVGKISLVYANFLAASCQCCKLQFVVNAPVATSLVIEKNAPAALLSNSTLDELYLAVKASDSAVIITTVARNGTVIKSETVTLADHAAKSILSITASDSSVTGFRVCGSGGLLRFIPFGAGAAGTEKVSDIAAPAEIVFANENYAILQSGIIYKNSTAGYVQNSVLNASVLFANDDAVISAAAVAILRNGVWTNYSSNITSVNCANIAYLSSGVTLEYAQTNDNWLLKKQLIKDTAAEITSISPVIIPARSHFYSIEYNAFSSDTMTIVTSDIDSNTQVPVINIAGAGNGSFFSGISYLLKSRGSDVVCEIGTAKVNSDTFKIIMRQDSLYYESNYLLGVNNFVCNTAYWAKRKIRYGRPWTPVTGCNIIVGADTVQISGAVTVNSCTRNKTSGNHNIVFNNRSLTCNFNISQSHPGGVLSVWSINGRMIGHVKFSGNVSSVSIPLQKIDQMIIARIDFSDGSKIENRFFPLR